MVPERPGGPPGSPLARARSSGLGRLGKGDLKGSPGNEKAPGGGRIELRYGLGPPGSPKGARDEVSIGSNEGGGRPML